jgi:DNA mismatch repair protein MutS
VTEHVHEHIGCKTVFATHYHELTQLADELPTVRNYNVAVREVGEQILFIHRLQPGGADRSYGIEVGRLAGLPRSVIDRAREMLTLLEEEQLVRGDASRSRDATTAMVGRREIASRDQLGLFGQPNPIVEQLATLDVNTMTPLEALSRLAALADEAKRSR